ncbi:hypothetical protein, unlikely [Trypanosoma brucei gambiense DAL972]|uniref:Uncharacterized protein n=1 Tax=Trypanosoma brucei gambiense (strain MHOM/CI/86/DAL972) TaxID=679716 RepID=D0A8E6_TRYB9|nr:hypothetical protein, unlikely [Trypanosoma brucei gambiense DAL972]CBH17947.1 hypothetical protein, unlikely [Trypanosoma brucei gambiense DAL972]|eukprot:XP_011780211.1 hypothetical protein, unlikely [Trypanosoma brucei gambiense DAL972]
MITFNPIRRTFGCGIATWDCAIYFVSFFFLRKCPSRSRVASFLESVSRMYLSVVKGGMHDSEECEVFLRGDVNSRHRLEVTAVMAQGRCCSAVCPCVLQL